MNGGFIDIDFVQQAEVISSIWGRLKIQQQQRYPDLRLVHSKLTCYNIILSLILRDCICQVWQWIRHQVRLEDDGTVVTRTLVSSLTEGLMEDLKAAIHCQTSR